MLATRRHAATERTEVMDIVSVGSSNKQAFRSYLPEDLFDKLPSAGLTAIGVVEHRVALGVLVARIENREATVVWLFVNEFDRFRGAAALMLEALEQAARKGGLTRLDAALPEGENREALCHLFSAAGYQIAPDEEGQFSFTVAQLPSDITGAGMAGAGRVVPLGEVDPGALRAFSAALQLMDAPVELPIVAAEYLPASRAAVKDGKVDGLCLIRQLDEETLELSYLHAEPEARLTIPAMLASCATEVAAGFPAEAVVTLQPAGDAAIKMLRKLIPDAKAQNVYYAYRNLW